MATGDLPKQGLRMGLELELEAIQMIFQKVKDQANPLANWGFLHTKSTMEEVPRLDGSTIVALPADDGDYYDDLVNKTGVNWHGDWGMHLTIDTPTDLDLIIAPDETSEQTSVVSVTRAVVEVNTSAQPIVRWHYWVASRIAFQALTGSATTMSEKDTNPVKLFQNDRAHAVWFTMKDFLTTYNGIFDRKKEETLRDVASGERDAMKLALDRFNLKAITPEWNIFVALPESNKQGTVRFTQAVQVNYEVPLSMLGSSRSIEKWTALWSSLWKPIDPGFLNKETHKMNPDCKKSGLVFDPYIGPGLRTADNLIFRTVLTSALWKMCNSYVKTQIIPDSLVANIMLRTVFRGFLTYLLTCSAVFTTPKIFAKNMFPQLPKSSPAGITSLLVTLFGADPQFKNLLASCTCIAKADIIKAWISENFTYRSELKGLEGQKRITTVSHGTESMVEQGFLNDAFDYLVETMPTDKQLRKANYKPDAIPPDKKHYYSKAEGAQSIFYQPANSTEAAARDMSHFEEFWLASLGIPPEPQTSANNGGFTADPPFYVNWARDVKTSIPAQRVNISDIKITVESRYDMSVMNVGFLPKVDDAIFNRSYLRIVQFMTSKDQLDTIKPHVDAIFKPNSDLVQIVMPPKE